MSYVLWSVRIGEQAAAVAIGPHAHVRCDPNQMRDMYAYRKWPVVNLPFDAN